MRCSHARSHPSSVRAPSLCRALSFLIVAMAFGGVPGMHVARAASDATLNVNGSGDAPGRGQEARRNAIANARNRLLISHLEFWSDSTQLSRLAPILDRGATYFRNVRVLSHEPDGETTHVEIAAELLVSKLRNDIGKYILPALDHKPTVIVVMQDDFGDDAVRSMVEPGVSEKMLRKVLRDAGFNVIESERLRNTLAPEDLLACVAGANSISAEAARSLFADAAIVGRATISVAEDARLTNLVRNRGSVAIRIVRADDDAIAEELHATGVVESRDAADGGPLAVEDACEKLKGRLTSGVIMAVLFSPQDDAVKLTMTGQPVERTRDEIIEWLAVQKHVDAVEIVSSDDGLIRVRLDYQGTMSDLVERLEEGASLEIRRVIDRDITAEFVSHVGGDLDR